jgi:hypothetical protein
VQDDCRRKGNISADKPSTDGGDETQRSAALRSDSSRTGRYPGSRGRPRSDGAAPFASGEEIIYVLEDTLERQIDGQPPVRLKTGDVFVPTGAIHIAKNVGTVPERNSPRTLSKKGNR